MDFSIRRSILLYRLLITFSQALRAPGRSTPISVTESPRRYISDKIVGGFINVLPTSYICSRRDIVR